MIHVGTSGWMYKHWQEIFYPESLRADKYLAYYCDHFYTVEVNSTFYHLPKSKTVERWRDRTPAEFVFAIKGSRYITHRLKLRECEEPVENFLERMEPLHGKTGVILWQLPPSLRRNDTLLKDFLELLPQNWRHTVEIRHESWLEEEVFQILRKARVCLCGVSMPKFPALLIPTTDFGYMRFHGLDSIYRSNYQEEQLQEWADRLVDLSKSADPIFVYFNNDVGGHAVFNAMRLREILRSRGLKVA